MGQPHTPPKTPVIPPPPAADIPAELSGIGGNDVMDILAGVEQQFDRLRQAQAARSEEVNALAARAAELDERQGTIEAQLAELAEREARLGEERSSVDADRSSLEAARAEMERVLVEQRTALERAAAEIDANRVELEAREAALREQRETLEARSAEVEARDVEAARRVKEAEHSRTEALGRLEQVESEDRALRDQLAEAEARIAQVREQADAAEQAAMELVMEAEQQRDDARTELAASESRAEALQGELEEARKKLEIAGGKLAGFLQILNSQGAVLDEADATATAELVQRQQGEIDELRRRLESAAAPTGHDEEREALCRRVEELTHELETSRAAGPNAEDAARLARLEAENGQLHEQLDGVRREFRKLRAAGENGMSPAAADERDALRDQVTELKARCAAAEEAVQDAREEMRRKSSALVVESNRLAEEGERQKQRGARLTKLSKELEQLRQEAADRPDPEEQRETCERIRREQRELERVRRMLANSEKQMIRRWGRSRAVIACFAMVAALVLTAAASWSGTSRVFPPHVTASVTVAADGLVGGGYSDETIAAWHSWHTALLYEETFHRAVSERMGDRLMEPYRTEAGVKELMVNEIAVDSDRPGMITLTVGHADAETARTILEVVASTIESESLRRMASRDDDINVVLVAGAEDAAPVRTMTVEDQRVQRALPIFGGSLVVVLALFCFAYVRFTSAKRVLDADIDLFEDPDANASVDMIEGQSLKEVPL